MKHHDRKANFAGQWQPGTALRQIIVWVVARVSAGRITAAFLFIATLLTALSVYGSYLHFVVSGGTEPNVFWILVALDGEQRIPTVFSSLLILANAALLLSISLLTWHERKNNKDALRWLSLGLIFCYLAVDELTVIHEEIFDFLIPVIGVDFLHFWVLPASVIVAGLALAYRSFVFALPSPTRNLFIASGLLYLGGAVGMETLGGIVAEAHGKGNFGYHLLANIEEFAEMVGMILFSYSLLGYLKAELASGNVTVGPR